MINLVVAKEMLNLYRMLVSFSGRLIENECIWFRYPTSILKKKNKYKTIIYAVTPRLGPIGQ